MTRCYFGAITLLACGALLASCASTPTSAELAEAILVSTATDPATAVTPEEALCIADELLASNLSDTTLSGLAENFANPSVLETEVNNVEPLVSAAALACR